MGYLGFKAQGRIVEEKMEGCYLGFGDWCVCVSPCLYLKPVFPVHFPFSFSICFSDSPKP